MSVKIFLGKAVRIVELFWGSYFEVHRIWHYTFKLALYIFTVVRLEWLYYPVPEYSNADTYIAKLFIQISEEMLKTNTRSTKLFEKFQGHAGKRMKQVIPRSWRTRKRRVTSTEMNS